MTRHQYLAVAVALSPLALSAQTQAPTPPPTMEACYVPASGTIYRINTAQSPAAGAPSACLNITHVRFTWNQQGPTGPMGPAGAGSGPVNGDLAGNLPAPSVTGLQGRGLASTAPAASDVLTFNGTQWEPQALPPMKLTKNAWNALTLDNADGFASFGTIGSGASIGTGARGTMLLWHPKTASFRAGQATGEWDEPNLGTNSVAMGMHTLASGYSSVAIGANNSATGRSSVALGTVTRASGDGSTALGNSTFARGQASTAMGSSTTASGVASTAMGHFTIAQGMYSVALGANADATFDGSFVFGDAGNRTQWVAPDQPNQFIARASGGVVLQVNPTGTIGCYLTQGSGGWQCTSDRAKKTGFRAVDGERLLGTLRAMPITTWRYRTDSTRTTHLGPTAQDFRVAFAVGADSLTIGSVDAQGVALAAAKALEVRTRVLTAENAELRAQLASMSARLQALEMHSFAVGKARLRDTAAGRPTLVAGAAP